MYPDESFGFSVFLTIVEVLLYYICIFLGLYNIYKIHKDPDVVNDPFEPQENIELEHGKNTDAGHGLQSDS